METAHDLNTLETGLPAILRRLDLAIEEHPGLRPWSQSLAPLLADPTTGLYRFLRNLGGQAPKPVVVFFDGADCLGGETLLAFLRQLRDGYINRDGKTV